MFEQTSNFFTHLNMMMMMTSLYIMVKSKTFHPIAFLSQAEHQTVKLQTQVINVQLFFVTSFKSRDKQLLILRKLLLYKI